MVILLVLLLIALAAGTIVESRTDTATAGRLVYYAPWFFALQERALELAGISLRREQRGIL